METYYIVACNDTTAFVLLEAHRPLDLEHGANEWAGVEDSDSPGSRAWYRSVAPC